MNGRFGGMVYSPRIGVRGVRDACRGWDSEQEARGMGQLLKLGGWRVDWREPPVELGEGPMRPFGDITFWEPR